MKIEAGKYYRTRGGHVVGPMRKATHGIWVSNGYTWHEDGHFHCYGADHTLDLISEVYVSDTLPADGTNTFRNCTVGTYAPDCTVGTYAPEAKTLRDEFAMAALTGMLTDRDCGDVPATAVASAAYEYADAMMEARKK